MSPSGHDTASPDGSGCVEPMILNPTPASGVGVPTKASIGPITALLKEAMTWMVEMATVIAPLRTTALAFSPSVAVRTLTEQVRRQPAVL